MGEIIYDTAMTLNGFLADEANSLEWLFAVVTPEDASAELTPPTPAVYVEGSTTYEWVLRHESLLAQPERWREYYGDRPTFVFTTRELPVPSGADVRFVSGSIAQHLAEIRTAAGGGDIWIVGGGELAGQFFDAGALDRVCVSIAPALLESGAPLLPRRVDPAQLELESAGKVGQFVRARYRVLR